MVYDRWGRVGVKGQDTIFGPYNLQDTAINEFEQKLPRPRTTGPTGYNANKLPLGTLSKSTILKGYDVLKRIADVIHLPDRRKLEQLSGEFYTVIPHDFGFQKMGDLVIDTPQKLKLKLEMVIIFHVKALGEIEVATNLLEDDTQIQIAKYLLNTHAKTHSSYSVDIVQIFRVEREGETERFKKLSNSKNRMLLWHGSRLTNWTGILSQGLRIAPPEAPATGYMFGKGVYFADMFSNSADYCNASPAATAGVLLLCEVALGDMSELLSANSDADKLPDGKLITKGVGQTAPDPLEAETLEDGVTVPLGSQKSN
ncbi:poly (ADP-ribose) polymerase 2 [Citrus sinensis]|nr:poly (ADP-ribose) polymerase 2 [Citrus sinensis]